MGIINKLMFWKKKKEEGFGDISNLGLPPETPPVELGLPKKEGFGLPHQEAMPKSYLGPEPVAQPVMPAAQPSFQSAPAQPSEQAYMASKNMEIISAKLDSLKAAIENINQRLANIERLAEEGSREERKPRW